MKKHPAIKTNKQSAHCPFTLQVLMQPMQVSPYAFNRHLRKQFICNTPSPSFKVYMLLCGCYVWVHSSGTRYLSAFPF